MEIKRIVTGRLPDGSSGILENEPTVAVSPAALAGLDFHILWATEEGGTLVAPPGQANPYWPGPNGTRFMIVEWSGQPAREAAAGEAKMLSGSEPDPETERTLPGLMGAFEPDGSGFHTSHSVDYGVCLEGEMWLRLDGEQEARITPGTCVVQRGTRHIWENRSGRPAKMLFVLVGTDDISRP